MDYSTILAEQFVEIWQTSKSVKDVADKLNRKISNVCLRASSYRRKGVPLKKFRYQPPGQLDYEKLKKIALKYAPKPEK